MDEKATASRIGGDEFAVLLPETTYEQTLEKIEAIRKSLAESRLEGIPVSASIGFAVHQNELYSFAETFKQADEKMYEQKLVESELVRKRVIRSIFQQNFMLFPGKKSEVYKALRLAKLFSTRLDMDSLSAIRVGKAAMVYDIGNIAIPYEYFVKKDKLDEKEWESIKTHPAAAYHILKNVIKFADVADIVLSHHENFDGTGYPRGLRSTQIPLEARILALITDYCAMTSSRPYRDELTREEAFGEVRRNAGLRYDPEFVELFIETVKESAIE
jgi:HD-GYP domain-containing protein (c-di-GMP phosphodiesterase class II)